MAMSRIRSTASASPTPSPTRRRRAARRRSISRTMAAAASITTAGSPSTFGPLVPWLTVSPGLAGWDADKDVWQLYDLTTDFSQAHDPRGRRAAASRRDEAALPGGGARDEQGVPGRRRPLDAVSIRRIASPFPIRIGISTRRRRGCRNSPRPASAGRATRSCSISRSPRRRPACSTRSAASRAG